MTERCSELYTGRTEMGVIGAVGLLSYGTVSLEGAWLTEL